MHYHHRRQQKQAQQIVTWWLGYGKVACQNISKGIRRYGIVYDSEKHELVDLIVWSFKPKSATLGAEKSL